MVFLQGIAAAALVPLSAQPDLQRIVVIMMVVATSGITLVVLVIVSLFAWKKPGLLFNPQDIDPSVHVGLYGPSERDSIQRAQPSPGISFSVDR